MRQAKLTWGILDEAPRWGKEQRTGDWDVWHTSLQNPNFAKYAKLCGAPGLEVLRADELDEAIGAALAHEGPALVEIRSDAKLV